MKTLILSIVSVLYPVLAHATTGIPLDPHWIHEKIEVGPPVGPIEIEAAKDSGGMLYFKIKQEDRWIDLPTDAFSDLKNPLLGSLQVTSYVQREFISIHFRDDYFDGDGAHQIEYVTLYFEPGRFVTRTITSAVRGSETMDLTVSNKSLETTPEGASQF